MSFVLSKTFWIGLFAVFSLSSYAVASFSTTADTSKIPSVAMLSGEKSQATRSISGRILTPLSQQWTALGTVRARSRSNTQTTLINTQGTYSFDQVDYTGVELSADLLVAPDQGVTTFDMLLIGDHILGTSPLSNAYQKVAADVTQDGSISARDIGFVRDLILGNKTFPDNDGIELIDASLDLSRVSDPFSLKDDWSLEIPGNTNDVNNADIMAVKLGDVNGSIQGLKPSRSNATITDQYVEAGQFYRIPMQVSQEPTAGFQFALSSQTHLRVYGADVNVFLDTAYQDGQLKIINTQELLPYETTIYLELTAPGTGYLSDFLSLSREWPAEVYSATPLSYQPLSIAWLPQTKQDLTNSTLISPNPFQDEFTARLFLKPGAYQLNIHDAAGRSFAERHIQSGRVGYYNLRFITTDWPEGTYILDLRGESHKDYVKLILQR